VQLLVASAAEIPSGLQYVAGLEAPASLLANLLLNRLILPLEAAISLARKVAAFEPRLDVRLVRKAIDIARDGVGSIPNADAMHVLCLVDTISDCSLLGSCLVQFLRHPCDKVRSKTALMLGRSNCNLDRVEALLSSGDDRLRANAVESLWVHRHQRVQKLLWVATRDSSNRVVANALLGLCLAGDRQAYASLVHLALTSNPGMQCSAAWAMGETGDPEFAQPLEKLEQDSNEHVRTMAGKSRSRLREPDTAAAAVPAQSVVEEPPAAVCENQSR
jgi:hypothetical protein